MIIENIHKELNTIYNYKNNIFCNYEKTLFIDIEEVIYKDTKTILLHYIKVSKFARNNGIATSIINKIIKICTLNRYYLIGVPTQLENDSMNTESLIKWYKNLGFCFNENNNNILELITFNKIIGFKDGLTLEIVKQKFPWILKADIDSAILGINSIGKLIWYDGIWHNGVWENGIWKNGLWLAGEWYNGTWEEGKWESGRYYTDIFSNKTFNGLKIIE